jgi:hypothetical protein
VSAELERLMAAQAAADAAVRQVADHDGGDSPHLMVAVIDPVTNTRLATGFFAYRVGPAAPALRAVGGAL